LGWGANCLLIAGIPCLVEYTYKPSHATAS
jgi:hypothetical protein